MEKRIIAVFALFCFLFGFISLRLYVLCTKGTEYVGESTHYFTVNVCDVRGDIYDCCGNKLTSENYSYVAAAKPTRKALASLENLVDGETLNSIAERMENGNVVTVDIGMNTVEDNDDITIVKKDIRYSQNRLAGHLIGYLDADGKGVTGLEKSFDDVLFTGKSRGVRFSADVYGMVISGAQTQILNSNVKKGSVTVTIDRNIQLAAENALDSSGVTCGGAVVLSADTGAIRAMVSRPDYDVGALSDYLNADNSPMINRGLNAYAVGSVFKIVVAASALETGITDFDYVCNGYCDIDGVRFGCNNQKAHGSLNMQKALECSCNVYFINLARKIGAEKLLETAKSLGFGQETTLADGIVSKSGVLPDADELKKSGALANFSFGQGNFSATMLQMCQMMSAVAGGGKYRVPYLVERVVTADGEVTEHDEKYPVTAFGKQTADRLNEMLVSVVENGNASKAKLKNDISAGGKTATAQTGSFNKNGVEKCNTWFCGYFPADNPKYIVVIMKEGGNSGAEDCAPIFKKIADKIVDF